LSALYVDTSALLSVILDGNPEIEGLLDSGNRIASALTLAEAHRALHRVRGSQEHRRERIERFRNTCAVLPIDDAVLSRAARAFPVEPLRTLDAIHLATALIYTAVEPVTLLSTDARMRENAAALGLEVLP
jgi:predicted nucleic acid-binding protein